jgi:hypothetical protein
MRTPQELLIDAITLPVFNNPMIIYPMIIYAL